MPNNIGFGVQAKGVGKASSDVDKLRDKFDKLGKTTAKGFGVGVGAGVALKGFSLLDTAASAFIAKAGDVIEGAMEQEESIARLGTALKANVANWDGDTAAIERVIKARMRLGVTDEELRDSLSTIIPATKDVNEALRVQLVALDLARFKKISLAEASEALTRVEAGSFRVLKSLGIALKDGATQTEALAAVEKIAAGQAEAWANTNRGKLLASQIELDEALEDFGEDALPLVIEGMTGAARAATGLAVSLHTLTDGVADTTEGQREQMEGFIDLGHALALLNPAFGLVADAEQDMLEQTIQTADKAGHAIDEMKSGVVGDLGKMEGAADDWRDTWHDVTGDNIRRANKVRNVFADTAQGLIDDFFDPIEIRADIYDSHMDLLAAEEARRNAKTKRDYRNASDDIMQSLDDQASSLIDLGKQGKLTKADVEKFAKDSKRNMGGMSKEARADINAIIARLRALAGMSPVRINVPIVTNLKGGGVGEDFKSLSGRGDRKARGGPASGLTLVGEEGPELLELPTGSYVTDAQKTKRMMSGGGGGGGLTFNVTVNAGAASGLTAGSARDLAQQIGPAIYADMQRRGLLSRGGTGLTG